MKQCRDCQQELPESEFRKFKASTGSTLYLRSWCKSCENIRVNISYHKTKKLDVRRQRNQEAYRALRELVFSHYGEDCVCCGEDTIEFLSIDHIEGGGNRHIKSLNGHFYAWLKNQGFPEGFQTLCMNCNSAKGRYGVCPHMAAQAKLAGKKGSSK